MMVKFNLFSVRLSKVFRRLAFLWIFSCVLLFVVRHLVDQRMLQTKLAHPVIYLSHTIELSPDVPATILLWTDYFEDPTWNGQTEIILPCGCLVTRNRSLLSRSAFVVFNWRNFDATDVPVKFKGQKWIWHHAESPTNTKRRELLSQFQKHVDCWATYRQDSDFIVDYGRLVKLDQPKPVKRIDVLSKPKFVAWMVSNCGAPSGRDQFAIELSKYIPVDIYGRCGSLSCSSYGDPACWDMIGRDYKFYLSLENSICPDYFTEKVIEPLNQDLIPIVMTGADIGKLLPPNSVIEARKFGSPRYLAYFLRSLLADETLYNSYFQWKANYTMTSRIPGLYDEIFCEICSAIEGTQFGKHCRGQKDNLVDWWFKRSPCRNP